MILCNAIFINETLFQLAAVLSDSCAELCQASCSSFVPALLHPIVSGFKKRAALYVSSLDQVTISYGFGSVELPFYYALSVQQKSSSLKFSKY
jgi:hypothetical protein